jgi:hypothetical protein
MATEWTIPQPVRRRPLTPTPTPATYKFDPSGDFSLDSAGRVPIVSGRASAVQAAAFLTTVQKGAYTRIFSRQFGIDLSGVIRATLPRNQKQSMLQSRMRRSAQRDTRIRDLEDFAFDWSGDILTVAYTLVLADGFRIRQEQIVQ